MSITKHIPNTITSLNLFTGCIGVYFAFQGSYQWAFLCILISGIFDFLDGFAARLFKAYSAIGKELDSLADVISFGLLPGAMVFALLSETTMHKYVPLVGFLIPVFSALRLAKFNIDERQGESFLGLAVPANAIFWGGAIYSFSDFFLFEPLILITLMLLFCVLLVSEIPMFSLKMKSLKWSVNKTQYIFLLGCLALLIFLKQNAFAPIIGWYITLSILVNLLCKKRNKNI